MSSGFCTSRIAPETMTARPLVMLRPSGPAPRDVEDVQVQLAAGDTAVLAYMLGDTHSYAWIITARTAKMFPLPARRVLEREVLAYRQMISRRPRSETDYRNFIGASVRLYRYLIAPAIKQMNRERHLVIIPDGLLHYLPFETLVRLVHDSA